MRMRIYSFFYLQDTRQSKSSNKLVCKPDPKNITLVFRPLMQFIDEVERALGVAAGQVLLYTWISRLFFIRFPADGRFRNEFKVLTSCDACFLKSREK